MVHQSLNVVCVLWVGHFRDRRYSPKWVLRLRRMVQKKLRREHSFTCFTNLDEIAGVDTIPLSRDWPGWWSKLCLFDPELQLPGRTIYFDLDTLITGYLDVLADWAGGDFGVMPGQHSLRGAQHEGQATPGIQSSVMVWDEGAPCYVFDRAQTFDFAQSPPCRGDQDFIERARHPDFSDQDVIDVASRVAGGKRYRFLPWHYFCKLRHCHDGPPEDVRVVLSMPWKNDEAAQRIQWVHDLWVPAPSEGKPKRGVSMLPLEQRQTRDPAVTGTCAHCTINLWGEPPAPDERFMPCRIPGCPYDDASAVGELSDRDLEMIGRMTDPNQPVKG